MIEKLVVYPTLKCNMGCKYCHYQKNDEKFLSYFLFERAIKKFLTISTKPEVIFLGGEPLINKKRILNFIRLIKKLNPNIPITIFTNGTLIDNKIAKLAKNKEIKIILSIDGNKETTDAFRVFKKTKKSVFDTAINNIKKYDLIKYVTINMALNKQNLTHLNENIKYLNEQMGFKSIGLNIDYSDNWQISDISKIKKEIEKIFVEYLKLIKEKKEIYEISNRYEIINYITNHEEKKCSNLILLPDGNFYPCDKIIGTEEKKLLSFALSFKNLEKERTFFFQKMEKKGFASNHLFCQCGIYLFHKYSKQSKHYNILKKLDTIFKIQQTINEITLNQFKILIKYNSFREIHGINYGK